MRTLDSQTAHQISVLGEEAYRSRIPSREKEEHHGEYVAIDTDGGRYAFGKTFGEAVAALSQGRPVALPFVRLVGMTMRLRHA